MQPGRPILPFLAIPAILALLAACQTHPTDGPSAPPARASAPYVQVLGTVQDGGLPHAACRCKHCAAARDQPDRARRVAALAVRLPQSGHVFLVDATPDIRPQLEELGREASANGVDRSPVDGVLLTHAHLGHYTGLAFFGYEAVHTSDLPVFSSPAMSAFLRANQPWRQLVEIGNIRIVEIRPGGTFELGQGVSVTPLTVPHRDELSDTLAFEIRGPASSLLYVPDTDRWDSWDPPIEQRVAGVDVALLDGTFFSTDEMPGRDPASIGHPLITDSIRRLEPIARRDKTAIYFTHLNHSNPALDPTGKARAQIEQHGFRVLDENQRFPL